MAIKMQGIFMDAEDIVEIIEEINRRYRLNIPTKNIEIWGEDGDSYPFSVCNSYIRDNPIFPESESFKLLNKNGYDTEKKEEIMWVSGKGVTKTGRIICSVDFNKIGNDIIFEKYGIRVTRFVNPTKYCDWPGEILGFDSLGSDHDCCCDDDIDKE